MNTPEPAPASTPADALPAAPRPWLLADDARVPAAMFSLLAANMRRGVPATLLALPIFYAALALQGPVSGFVPWLLAVLMLPLAYFALVLPRQKQAMAAARFAAVSRELIVFHALFGTLWGLAAVAWFDPEPLQLVVLVVTVSALAMSVCFAAARDRKSVV